MRWIDRLSLAQRLIVVIALAAGLVVLGTYIVTLGNSGTGLVASSQLGGHFDLPSLGLRPGLRLVVWLALIALWAGVSVRILRPSHNSES